MDAHIHNHKRRRNAHRRARRDPVPVIVTETILIDPAETRPVVGVSRSLVGTPIARTTPAATTKSETKAVSSPKSTVKAASTPATTTRLPAASNKADTVASSM